MEPQSIISQGTMEREWKMWKNDGGRRAYNNHKHKKATKIEHYKFSTKAHTNNKQEKVILIVALM